MPLTIKRTNSTSIATNSVLFNGSNQYLSVANNAAFNFGTGSFTVECWFYATANVSSNQCLITNYGGPSTGWSIEIISGVINANLSGDVYDISGGSLAINTWYHVALSGAQGSVKLFLNGVQVGSTYTGAVSMNTSAATTIGAIIGIAKIAGYISNVRVVKGTALYTSSFTVPTSPLTAIANTSLLACQSATIVDSSTNNFAITNNNAATVSSITPTFVAPINNFQFARRTSTAVAKSVVFNGSNQYLSVGSVANWAFLNNGLTPFTIEAWINPTSVATAVQPNIVATTGYQAQIGFYFVIGNYNNGDLTFAICDGRSKINQWATSNNFLTANTWTHVAVSFTPNGTNVPSATVKFFVNGILATSSNVVTNTTTYSTSNPTNTLLVGALQTPLADYFPGYISNLRILNGTALYTSSFTVPTSPLTAIANTALLTCNAATIVDSSTNNFAITNNNAATVSSISPFVVSSGGMSLKKVFADAIIVYLTQKAIFGYGYNNTIVLSMTNLVNNTGVVATDTTGVGTARTGVAATGYGTDKAIFGYGYTSVGVSMTNLVSNTGVVATDISGVGTARGYLGAAKYGADKAIFVYGYTNPPTVAYSISNLVSNTGVVSTDTVGVGTARYGTAQASYGNDKAIFGYGWNGSTDYSVTNLVSNTGVVATDTTGVGTARHYLAATSYGTDKAIFGYGLSGAVTAITNLVSNTGVVATDTTGVGTARSGLAGSGYGTDKGIFGYGTTGTLTAITNLVSNTGVVASDTTGVGTARQYLAAAGYSLT